ncbi:MAG: flagellar hook assembly protein FlgD [Steroidobacteraceae bacterium]
MNTVNPASSTNGALAQGVGKSMSSLGINDFITLMTTQLKYQDPTNPQDSTAFVAQLAQFSSVSGIQEMNTSISSLLDQMRSSQAVNATALVGHGVLVQADTVALAGGSQLSGEINTPTGTSNINVVVSDGSGQVVRHLTVPVTTGTSAFTWDGLDDAGKRVDSGNYKLTAIANVYGTSTSVATALNTRVDSVSINPTDNSLVLNTSGLGSINLSDVRRVL